MDPQTYQPISGNLPFQPAGNPIGASTLPGAGALGNAYQSSYQSALSQNQALYTDILSGYNQIGQQQVNQQNQIGQGYQNLGNQVQGTIQGITASQQQAIADAYAQQSGAATQNLVSSGLGNSTVQSSVQRGLLFDKEKANIALANQQAQLSAGYQSQLGLAGLGYQNQAAQQQQQQGNQALGWMNTVQAQYPNAQSYMGLLQNQGAYQAYQDWLKQHPYQYPQAAMMQGNQQPIAAPNAAPNDPSGIMSGYGGAGMQGPITYTPNQVYGQPQQAMSAGGDYSGLTDTGVGTMFGGAAGYAMRPNYAGQTDNGVGAMLGGAAGYAFGNPYAPGGSNYQALQGPTPGIDEYGAYTPTEDYSSGYQPTAGADTYDYGSF